MTPSQWNHLVLLLHDPLAPATVDWTDIYRSPHSWFFFPSSVSNIPINLTGIMFYILFLEPFKYQPMPSSHNTKIFP